MSKVRTNLTPKVYTDGLTVLAKRAKLTRKCYVEKSFAPVREPQNFRKYFEHRRLRKLL